MAASVIVGLSLQLLADEIKRAKERSGKARTILESLEATIVSVLPMLNQIEKLSKILDTSPEDVMLRLDTQVKKVVELVKSYHELRSLDLVNKRRYRKRLIEMDESLRHLVTIDIQVQQSVDLKNLFFKMTEMNKNLEKMSLDVNPPVAVEVPSSSHGHGHCQTCSCHPPSCSPKRTFEFIFKFGR